MAVLKYKSGNQIRTLGVVKSGVSGVTSVNGKTGAITGLYDAKNQPPYPVKSVNGQTGNVVGWNYFSSQPLAGVSGSLPAGNTMIFYLDFDIEGQIQGGLDGIIFRFDASPLLWNVKPLSATRVEVLFINPGGIPDDPPLTLSSVWMRCFSVGRGVIKNVSYSPA